MADITWTNEKRKLGDLMPWKRNPRQIKKAEGARLAESLDTFGQIHPIAIGPDDEIYDGHQRQLVWSALDRYGAEFEVDVRVSSRTLTEREREQLVVFLHRGTVAEWDWDVLANEFEVGDLLEWGFTDFDLQMHGLDLDGDEPPADPGPQVDRASALRENWRTKEGQLWQLGIHRLALGDCEDEKVIAALMQDSAPRYGMHDPPYGINVVGSAAAIGGAKPFGKIGFDGVVPVNVYAPVLGDNKPFDPTKLISYCSDSVFWGANYYADKLPPKKGWLVWDKKGREDWRDTFSDCELAWTAFDITTRIYRHVWMGMVQEGERETRYHPTQKPAALFEKIMNDLFVDDGIVIDFYAGSGPTLIACERLGKPSRLIELSPDYGAVIIQRWVDMGGEEPELLERFI